MKDRLCDLLTVGLCGALLLALSLACWFRAPQALSLSERRALAQRPELSLETVLSGDYMERFESYAQDQYPLRDGFRRLKALTAMGLFLQKDNNGLYYCDGHLGSLDATLSEDMLSHAAERFQYLYDTYLAGKDMELRLCIVPDKNYYLAAKNGYPALDWEALNAYFADKLPYLQPIDITGLLSADDYYRTDSHWRQENLLPVAGAIGDAFGVSVSAEYQTNTLDIPFYGVYYGQSALPVGPDTIRYLINETLESCVVTSYDTGMPKPGAVYDLEGAGGNDTYDLFLSGADALITVENPNAATDRELILFRDSYGSSLAPLLAEGYARITLVDIRYIQSGLLDRFITFEDQDVLFLYSAGLLNNSLALR